MGLFVRGALEVPRQRAFYRGAAKPRIALACVWSANRQERAVHSDGVVHRRTLADTPIVYVANGVTWRDGVDIVSFLWRQTHRSKVRVERNADVFKHVPIALGLGVVHQQARIVNYRMHLAGWVGDWNPFEIVDCLRPIALACRVNFVDRDNLARLIAGDQVLVMEAPVRRGV